MTVLSSGVSSELTRPARGPDLRRWAVTLSDIRASICSTLALITPTMST